MDTLFRMAPATYLFTFILVCIAFALHRCAIKMSPNNRAVILFIFAVEALYLIGISSRLSFDRVHSDAEKAQVQLGWPLKHLIQNQSHFDPPYPWNMSWAWESQGKTVVWKMFVNWLFYTSILCAIHQIVWRKRNV